MMLFYTCFNCTDKWKSLLASVRKSVCACDAVCVLFPCVYSYRNICGIVILCAEVSLHNRVGWREREAGGADSTREVPTRDSG